MMKVHKHIVWIILSIAVMLFFSCTKDDSFLSGDGETVSISYRPTLKGDLNTRSIGDASGIDRIQIVVYEGSEQLSKVYSISETWEDAKRYGISLTLIEGRSYKILFWAEDKDNTAYVLTDEGMISVNYDDYTDGGFEKMEEMDAFFATSLITVGSQKIEDKTIELSRPFGKLNFTDKSTSPEEGTHQSVVTFHSIPTSFNPFTGEVNMTDADDDADDVTFTFTDFPDETLELEGVTYYYVSSNYLFVSNSTSSSTNISATLELQGTDGTPINSFEFKDTESIAIGRPNMMINVYGNIMAQWSVWDGKFPTETTLEKDEQNRYIINEAADLAWLSKNGGSLSEGCSFLQTVDIDMNNKDVDPVKLPAGSTWDGGGKKIKNYKNSLFGDAISLVVKNIKVENVAASGSTHVGTLVNTLKGSSSFTDISVSNSIAAATNVNSSAGGMIGYIERISEKDRTETLNVTFSNCILDGVTVSATAGEGKFVGLLNGYDNKESLTFDSDCNATDVNVTDYTSVYTKANNSCWVTVDVTDKYDGWLGHETYRRAKVTFGGVRLVPRWDGKTVVAKSDLLLYNGSDNQYEVYSPYDLAGVRNATPSPSALYLMENVDMHGQGADGKYFVHEKFTKSASDPNYSTIDDDNHFKSFDYVDYLEGNNNSIYNLSVYSTFNGATTYYGAFILYCRNTTTHQNINLRNCCTVVPHVVKDNEDKSYGAAFVCNNDCSTYKMDNVHAFNCKVFALQKTGTLVGRLGVNSSGTINNCSVNDCYIENYNCKDHQEDFAGGIVKFYTPGEVGGMFGFVEDNVTISNCHVRGTTIHAYGQDDKSVLLFIKIPGRHVSKFIGDIRTSENTDDSTDKIVMTNCTVDAATQCTNRYDKHSSTYTTIGKVYYVSLAGDKKGTVTYDGKNISF